METLKRNKSHRIKLELVETLPLPEIIYGCNLGEPKIDRCMEKNFRKAPKWLLPIGTQMVFDKTGKQVVRGNGDLIDGKVYVRTGRGFIGNERPYIYSSHADYTDAVREKLKPPYEEVEKFKQSIGQVMPLDKWLEFLKEGIKARGVKEEGNLVSFMGKEGSNHYVDIARRLYLGSSAFFCAYDGNRDFCPLARTGDGYTWDWQEPVDVKVMRLHYSVI